MVFFPRAFRVSRQRIGASELKACQRRQRAIHYNARVIQILLKLFCGLLALMQRQVGLATDIHGIERAADLELRKGRAEFVVRCCLEELDGSRRISAINLNGSIDSGQPIVINDGVEREACGQVVRDALCFGVSPIRASAKAARILTSRVEAVVSAVAVSCRDSATLLNSASRKATFICHAAAVSGESSCNATLIARLERFRDATKRPWNASVSEANERSTSSPGLAPAAAICSLHSGSVVFEKGNAITVAMQEGIINFVVDGLLVLFFRLIEMLQGCVQSYKVGIGGGAAGVQPDFFSRLLRHLSRIVPNRCNRHRDCRTADYSAGGCGPQGIGLNRLLKFSRDEEVVGA